MSSVRKISRSVSLPESCDHETTSESTGWWWKAMMKKISRSLTRVDDRSNSAAPIRRQPHPFAMQALGMRSGFGGRWTRLPEWPPPDPPPLTPLNFGIGRPLSPAGAANNTTPIWPPRPWWRRNVPPRPTGPIVHVTIDTADVINPIPMRLIDRPARVGWTNSSEQTDQRVREVTEEENTPVAPQQASVTDVEDSAVQGDLNSSIVATSSRPLHSMESWAQLRIHPQSVESTAVEQSSNVQLPPEELAGITAVATEDVGMISLSSEEVQEESTFQIFFVVLDSNPTVHTEFRTNEPDLGLLPMTLELIRQQYGRQAASSRDDPFADEESSSNQ